jgi:uncharacterized repeat protein (TIGR02543 family)
LWPPETTPATLTANVWADGDISSDEAQWFQFTATAATQYIHANFNGTLSSSYGIYVQLYDNNGAAVRSTGLYGSTKYISQTLTSGQVYYIKVSPYTSSYTGTYQIGFTASIIPPSPTILTANTWADGSLTSTNNEQWFQFTATAATQYIHANFGTLNDLYVQLYDSSGTTVGNQANWYGSTTYIARTLTGGQVYYIKVWPYSSSGSGTYQIGFNTFPVPPGTTITVTFDTQSGSAIDPVTVDYGSQVNQPANPTRTGCTFANWYTALNGGSVVVWPLTATSDTTVYAHWTAVLTFDTQGGSAIDPVTVNADSEVNRPVDPTRTGYAFNNWYTTASGGDLVTWPLTVNGNTTVYARWYLAGQGSITVSFSGLPQDETTNLSGTTETLSWMNGTLNVSVPTASFTGASYQWYLDNAALSGATVSSLSKPGSDFTLGRHEITVRIITTDNKVYSKTLRFTVVQ